ncbi:protein STRUBBELIG-RECEPTOR FAMILY 3-like [Bidens hawaiensis]|uniref:protein STRUBBELIG-RECEPTOR FAMILY 3-like n=1 Tax=Bidens hawaiensis TaxID=980011 RepID=UPI00404A0D1C
MWNSELKIYTVAVVGSLLVSIIPSCFGFTDPGDSVTPYANINKPFIITITIIIVIVIFLYKFFVTVIAINSLYATLGFPPLLGWRFGSGDPCSGGWQGVQCVNSNITGIVLNNASLGGELSDNLGAFASIIQIDLSNNHIGGSIPSNLPLTLKTLFLSGNQLVGSMPESLSMLGQLTDLSLNNNHCSIIKKCADSTNVVTIHECSNRERSS